MEEAEDVPSASSSKLLEINAHLMPKPGPAPPGETPRLRLLESMAIAWLPVASFAFMVYSSIRAIYVSKGDPGTVTFVSGSFSILCGLYWCMHEYERSVSQRAAIRRNRFKLAIWVLAMALNTLFSYRVTSVMDSTILFTITWTVTATTSVVGCYIIFSSQGSVGAAAAAMPQ